MKKIKIKKTRDGVEIPIYEYSVDTAHPCKAKGNKEVIFSTYFSPDFICPFCKEKIMELA